MRTIEDIATDLKHFSFDAGANFRLSSLASEIESHPDGPLVLADVLKLFERSSCEDFGSPGPLAHVAERFYGKGYEDELEASLRRRPTLLTVWLANRIANAGDANSPRFLRLLQEVTLRTDVERETVNEAEHFLSLHQPP